MLASSIGSCQPQCVVSGNLKQDQYVVCTNRSAASPSTSGSGLAVISDSVLVVEQDGVVIEAVGSWRVVGWSDGVTVTAGISIRGFVGRVVVDGLLDVM